MNTKLLSVALLGLLPIKVHASLNVSDLWYGGVTWSGVITSVVRTLQNSGIIICGVMFFIGAIVYATAAGNEGRKGKGVEIMQGSLIGVAIIAGALAILNAVGYFIIGV